MMESCTAVEALVDTIISNFTAYGNTYSNSLEHFINQITNIRRELLTDVSADSEVNLPTILILENWLKRTNEALQRMGTEHRNLHSSVSKCGREIDKTFTTDLSGITPKELLNPENTEARNSIDRLIANHLLTQGLMGIAETLAKESGIQLDETHKKEFSEMNRILHAIRHENLEPALEWIERHHSKLQAINSSLEFHICKMKFIKLLTEAKADEALHFAKHFQSFSENHKSELPGLMGALVYSGSKESLAASPYKHLLDPIVWEQLADHFARDACALLGLSVQSPLSIIIQAGTIALPALMNIRQILVQRQVFSMWAAADELPIEIPLNPESRFHSIFSCPILRQPNSHPCRLVCGHVISRDALLKLANNQSRLKCPYCPVESAVVDAKPIYF